MFKKGKVCYFKLNISVFRKLDLSLYNDNNYPYTMIIIITKTEIAWKLRYSV